MAIKFLDEIPGFVVNAALILPLKNGGRGKPFLAVIKQKKMNQSS